MQPTSLRSQSTTDFAAWAQSIPPWLERCELLELGGISPAGVRVAVDLLRRIAAGEVVVIEATAAQQEAA